MHSKRSKPSQWQPQPLAVAPAARRRKMATPARRRTVHPLEFLRIVEKLRQALAYAERKTYQSRLYERQLRNRGRAEGLRMAIRSLGVSP